jgi:hypothetical protein
MTRDELAELHMIKGGPALTFPGCFKAGFDARDEEVASLKEDLSVARQSLYEVVDQRNALFSENKRLRDALEFIANDLDQIGVTPTEISHLAKARHALKATR